MIFETWKEPPPTEVLGDLVSLIERAYRGEAARAGWTHEADLLGGQRINSAMLREIAHSPCAAIILARGNVAEGPALMGCVVLEQRQPTVGYLGLLTVSPERQGRDIGKRLVAAAEAAAQEHFAVSTMEMTVIEQRAELIDWYHRLGYRRTGETRPFPYGDERFGKPKRDDLRFVVLSKPLML